MDEAVMTEASGSPGPQRRRSPRLGSPQALLESDNKMALGAKRLITVRKIAPRKTAAPSQPDKENTPDRSGPNKENTPDRSELHLQQKKQKLGTPDPVPGRRPSSSFAGRKKQQPQTDLPSPVLPSTPAAEPRTQQPAAGPEHAGWSQKVRRSYSRLSERSLCSPGSGEPLFGFELLQTPQVASSRTALDGSGSSFVSLLEAEESCTEPDPNIPGVAVVKQRRRRRKVQQIHPAELDALAARMNQEFREAEEFELVVE